MFQGLKTFQFISNHNNFTLSDGISSKTCLWHIYGNKSSNNIFEILPVTSANVTKTNMATIFLSLTRSTNIILYLFYKIITLRDYAFLIKTCTIFITIHGFAFSYISRIPVSITFP